MKILILCTGNSCRSQMAHGFLQSFDANLQVFSAGTHPAEQVNPHAVEVMAEAGIVPIIEVFVAKGIPIGTALAFMMAVVGLSLPEATLLKKVMTWRLIGIFFGIITLFIILSGYLFNAIL